MYLPRIRLATATLALLSLLAIQFPWIPIASGTDLTIRLDELQDENNESEEDESLATTGEVRDRTRCPYYELHDFDLDSTALGSKWLIQLYSRSTEDSRNVEPMIHDIAARAEYLGYRMGRVDVSRYPHVLRRFLRDRPGFVILDCTALPAVQTWRGLVGYLKSSLVSTRSSTKCRAWAYENKKVVLSGISKFLTARKYSREYSNISPRGPFYWKHIAWSVLRRFMACMEIRVR